MSIKALLSRADGSDETIDLAKRKQRIAKDELLWVDLVGDDTAELELLCSALDLSDQCLTEISRDIESPSASVLDGAVSVSLLSLADGGEKPVPMHVLVGDGWILTRHAEPMEMLDEHREKITDQREIGLLSSVGFLVSILDWHIDSFFRAAEELEADVDKLDDAALVSERDILGRMVRMRRRIARVRHVAAVHREVFAELARPDFLPALAEEDNAALARTIERLARASEAISHVRDMLIGTFDVYMTRTAQRTNDIMRVLTWASVILLPAAVIAGIMGMNFKVPIFDNSSLFFVVIGLMVVLAATTLLVARWRNWL